MNTTLPPSRDLPSARHAEIRAAVLVAAAPRPSRRWVAPLVTAAVALVVIGMVAWFAPWDPGTPAAQPPRPTSRPTTSAAPSVDGIAAEDVPAVEKGCGQVTFPRATFTLLAVLTDEAGRLALLRGEAKNGVPYLIECILDFTPAMPYNGSGGTLEGFVSPLSVDLDGASAGGDAPGGKAEYAGKLGTEVLAGRVSPDVVKVTVTRDAQTREAKLAGGLYIARLVHPADWVIPEQLRPPIVRAYDKNGTVLAEIGV
jgi:hypothetical protein